MNRGFETHIVRDVKSLDGIWQFVPEGSEKEYKMPVPGCWEQHPDFTCYKGKGTFSRTFYVKKCSNLRFEFKGVSHTGEVFLDGVKIGQHYNAYTPFSVIAKNVSSGEHTIAVTVDNSYNESSALHVPNDYYTYKVRTEPKQLEARAFISKPEEPFKRL